MAASPPDPIQVEDKRGGCTISVAAALPNPILVEDKRGGCASFSLRISVAVARQAWRLYPLDPHSG